VVATDAIAEEIMRLTPQNRSIKEITYLGYTKTKATFLEQ